MTQSPSARTDVEDTRGVFRVPVAGGELAVRDLNPGAQADAPLALLVHGITANGATWALVAAQLAAAHGDGLRIWAPDLRGRALSREVSEPAGVAAHVADLAAVLDHARAQAEGAREERAEGDSDVATPRPVVVGHSMGAFVTALLAATHPDRVGAVVLVDGGFAFPSPPDLDVDAALAAVIGPAMDRLSMRFASPKAYLDFWAQHPAVGPLLAGPKVDTVRAYLLSDLVPTPEGDYRSSCVADVIRADGADILIDDDVLTAGRRAVQAGVPVEFLWAERGLLNQTPGLYSEEVVAALGLPEAVTVTAVPDIDHYGILLAPGPAGPAGAVCAAVDTAIEAAAAR